MSFTIPKSPPARPNRCQLFGPGSRPELFPKMAASAADVVNLDLEDSVPPADKAAARANIVKAISAVDWGTKTLSVRINGLDTEFWYRDVVDLLEQGDPDPERGARLAEEYGLSFVDMPWLSDVVSRFDLRS